MGILYESLINSTNNKTIDSSSCHNLNFVRSNSPPFLVSFPFRISLASVAAAREIFVQIFKFGLAGSEAKHLAFPLRKTHSAKRWEQREWEVKNRLYLKRSSVHGRWRSSRILTRYTSIGRYAWMDARTLEVFSESMCILTSARRQIASRFRSCGGKVD